MLRQRMVHPVAQTASKYLELLTHCHTLNPKPYPKAKPWPSATMHINQLQLPASGSVSPEPAVQGSGFEGLGFRESAVVLAEKLAIDSRHTPL